MFLPKVLLALSAFGLVAANTITFVSLDENHRTVYSRHKLQCEDGDCGYCNDLSLKNIPPLDVPGLAQVDVQLPMGWEGNFYSVPTGTPDRTGMLAEIRSQGYENASFFDVSAIENPNDHVGVKQFWPADEPNAEVSGCIEFPCPYTYYHSDDKQTKPATWSEKFYCTLGNADLSNRPHLAKWQKVYDPETNKWEALSVANPAVSLIAVPGLSAATRGTTVESPTTTHTAVTDETDATDETDVANETDITSETAFSHQTFVTLVKKHTATPTFTASS